MKNVINLVYTFLIVFNFHETTFAQEGPPPPQQPFTPHFLQKNQGPPPFVPPPPFKTPKGFSQKDWEDKDLRELIDTVRFYRMSRYLELTDEQTVLLMRRYDEWKKHISDIWERRNQAIQKLREKVSTGAPESELQQILDELRTLEEENHQAKLDLVNKTSEGLTVTQRAKLIIFMQDFEKDIRRLLERAREMQGPGKEQLRDQLRQDIQNWRKSQEDEKKTNVDESTPTPITPQSPLPNTQ